MNKRPCNKCYQAKELTTKNYHTDRDGFKITCKPCTKLIDLGLGWQILNPKNIEKPLVDPRPFQAMHLDHLQLLGWRVRKTKNYVYKDLLPKQKYRCAGCSENLRKEFQPNLNYILGCTLIQIEDSDRVVVCGSCAPHADRMSKFKNIAALRRYLKDFKALSFSSAVVSRVKVVADYPVPLEAAQLDNKQIRYFDPIYIELLNQFPTLRATKRGWKIETFEGHRQSRAMLLGDALLSWVGTKDPLRASIKLHEFVSEPNYEELQMKKYDIKAWNVRRKEKEAKIDKFIADMLAEARRDRQTEFPWLFGEPEDETETNEVSK